MSYLFSFAVEQRRYKAELTTFNVTINNKLLNTSDPVTQRRLSDPNDSLYKETKNTMEPQVNSLSKFMWPFHQFFGACKFSWLRPKWSNV